MVLIPHENASSSLPFHVWKEKASPGQQLIWKSNLQKMRGRKTILNSLSSVFAMWWFKFWCQRRVWKVSNEGVHNQTHTQTHTRSFYSKVLLIQEVAIRSSWGKAGLFRSRNRPQTLHFLVWAVLEHFSLLGLVYHGEASMDIKVTVTHAVSSGLPLFLITFSFLSHKLNTERATDTTFLEQTYTRDLANS